MEKTDCPICGQDNAEKIFNKGNLDKDLINVICKKCSLVYINPRQSREEYDDFHKEEFLSEKSVTSIEQVKPKLNDSDLKIKTAVFNFLDEYLKEEQNVLDVGCGFGVLLDIIKRKKNANVFGVELGNLDVEAAKKYYGLDLFRGSLENFAKDEANWGKFDVIIMHHTLEHLPEPLNSLEEIKKLLKPGGVLYIGVPNIMNIKKRPEIFFQRAHPFSYSPHSLMLILEKAGFGIIKFNRNAGYPGGMEMAAGLGKQSIKDVDLDEGKEPSGIMRYIEQTKKKYSRLRGLRDIFLFFIPKSARIKLGIIFYRAFKGGVSDKQFFKVVVLPSSVIAGVLFILHHIFIFIKVTASGKIYNLFSFHNIDPLINYAPFVRAVFDGSYRVVDGRILENFFLPNLWTQLSPILIAPLFHLTGSISYAFLLGHFLVAAGAFICFYLLCFYIIKNRLFSLFYSFIFISVTLVFDYLFPTSLDNLRLAGRTILPFGSPSGEVLLSKYISFAILPGLLFFVSSFLFVFLALTGKRKIFIVLAGLNLGILPYIVMTHFIYVGAALFCTLILFSFYKDYSSVKKILWIYTVAIFGSAFYWFNFLQIKMLPWSQEFYGRLGGEITHQFRWSYWPEYIAYIAMALFILYFGKKYRKRKESIFVAGSVLAAILVLNIQVIFGYNPHPLAWLFHQVFLGFALGWLVLIYWIYIFLIKKFNKRLVVGFFLMIFLMIIGKFIYTEYYAAGHYAKYDYMPRDVYDSLQWLNRNTEKDSVVATPSLTTNALLPAFTHNNSMLPMAITSPLSLEDIKDRYFVNYKFLNVSAEYFEKALRGDLPIGTEQGLQGALFFDYYCDHSLDANEKPNSRSTASASEALDDLVKEYARYPKKREYLLNKYRIDYIYYGPYERNISRPDFDGFEKVYDKDGIEIYKKINTAR